MFILDTNVLSALMGSRPIPDVANWMAGQAEESLFTSTISEAEILAGNSIQSRRVIVCCTRQWGKSTTAAIKALHHAFHLLLSAKLNTTQALEKIGEEITDSPEVAELARFIQDSNRGVTK